MSSLRRGLSTLRHPPALRRRTGSGVVLAYHRVARGAVDPWGLAIDPAHFAEHLGVLRSRWRPCTTVELARASRRGGRAVALTFDDGYLDNLLDALPLLERHEIPATVFIATGLVDSGTPWWDRLAATIYDTRSARRAVLAAAARLDLLGVAEVDAVASAPADDAHRRLYEALVGRPQPEVRHLVAELVDASGIDPVATLGDTARVVTSEELGRLATHPLITIGVHTVDHPWLTACTDDEIAAQIGDCLVRLTELLGRSPTVFAYPYGFVDDRVADVAASFDFDACFTMAGGWIRPSTPRHRMPRWQPPDVAGRDFEHWMQRL